MKVITNILISVLSFAISYGIAHLTGSVIVKNAVLLAYVIHWIAYIPAYVFQTEKFYDLTGSVTYLSVVWFVFLSTYQSISLNFGNLILDLNNSARAKLYKNKQLVFIGDGYIALKMFLKD